MIMKIAFVAAVFIQSFVSVAAKFGPPVGLMGELFACCVELFQPVLVSRCHVDSQALGMVIF